MNEFIITNAQAHELPDVLLNHLDGSPVTLSMQGSGTLMVYFDLATVEITPEGEVEEN